MSTSFKCPKCGRVCEQQYCLACDSEFDNDGLLNFDDTLVDTDDEDAVGQDEAAWNDALPEKNKALESLKTPGGPPRKLSTVVEEYRRAWEEWQRDYPAMSANQYATQWTRTDKKKRVMAGKKPRTAATLTRAWRKMNLR